MGRIGDKHFVAISTYIPCILIIIKVFSPTDAQLDSLKKNFKSALTLNLPAPTTVGARINP